MPVCQKKDKKNRVKQEKQEYLVIPVRSCNSCLKKDIQTLGHNYKFIIFVKFLLNWLISSVNWFFFRLNGCYFINYL